MSKQTYLDRAAAIPADYMRLSEDDKRELTAEIQQVVSDAYDRVGETEETQVETPATPEETPASESPAETPVSETPATDAPAEEGTTPAAGEDTGSPTTTASPSGDPVVTIPVETPSENGVQTPASETPVEAAPLTLETVWAAVQQLQAAVKAISDKINS